MIEERYSQILLTQINRYPKMGIEDLYKLIHQASLGSEHAVKDHESARKWLESEISGLIAGIEEPVLEEISLYGKIVRVHLWPYFQDNGDPEMLLQAFIRTANEFSGSHEDLFAYWKIAVSMAGNGELPFNPGAMRTFFVTMREMNFPSVHHSKIYEREYHPAYRVVAREYFNSFDST